MRSAIPIKIYTHDVRINRLSSVAHKFKVSKNAEQLKLTGCALIGNGANMVVAEGGAKAIRMYKRWVLLT